MTVHVDPAVLVEMALANGDRALYEDQRIHLIGCSECRRELHALGCVVRAARSANPGDLITEPPECVWRSIQQRMRMTEDSQVSIPGRACRSGVRWCGTSS